MLADDDVLLDELGEEDKRALQASERRPLMGFNPSEAQVLTRGAATTSQVFCPLIV